MASSILWRSVEGDDNGVWASVTTKDIDQLKGDIDVLYNINLLDLVIESCGFFMVLLGLCRNPSVKIGLGLLGFLLVWDLVLQAMAIMIANKSLPVAESLRDSTCMRKSAEYNTVVGLSGELNTILYIGVAEVVVAVLAVCFDVYSWLTYKGEETFLARCRATAFTLALAFVDLSLAFFDFVIFSASAKEETDQLIASLTSRAAAWCVVPTDASVAFFEGVPGAEPYKPTSHVLLSTPIWLWILLIIFGSGAIFSLTCCLPRRWLEGKRAPPPLQSQDGAGTNAFSLRRSEAAALFSKLTRSEKEKLSPELAGKLQLLGEQSPTQQRQSPTPPPPPPPPQPTLPRPPPPPPPPRKVPPPPPSPPRSAASAGVNKAALSRARAHNINQITKVDNSEEVALAANV